MNSNSNNAKKLVWPPPFPKLRTKCLGGSFKDWEKDYERQLQAWYAEYIESLGPGVAVTGDYDPAEDVCYWSNISDDCDTHRALLIAVQPIAELTADDLLVDYFTLEGGQEIDAWTDKARAYLEKRKR